MNHRVELFVAVQRILPKHFLSRAIGKLAESTQPWLKNLLIKSAIKVFDIDLEEAKSDSLESYDSFNAFFTRELKDGARPIDHHHDSVCCPADGMVSQAGKIDKNRIMQAKGINYSVARLIGDSTTSEHYQDGSFATIYLSPRDYHRVHMPVSGKLIRTRYVPGDLFSVNDLTAQGLPGLFARNERLVCEFESELMGHFTVILVGAMLVAGIETVWGGAEVAGAAQVQETLFSEQELIYTKGEEIGRFKFGSTAIVLFQKQTVSGFEDLQVHQKVKMGEAIATVT
jgi:phosphatidylserine decarboxylase